MKNYKSIVAWIFRLCVLAALVFVTLKCYETAYTAYANEPFGEDRKHVIEVVVEEGNNYMDVGKQLVEKGLMDSWYSFVLRATFSQYRNGLKPGNYEINEAMGIDDVLITLTQASAN